MPDGTADFAGLHKAALAYAARGWPVFPCVALADQAALSPRDRKKPACEHGYLDATTDPNRISEWWTKNPDANIGLSPEAIGRGVIDLDGADGEAMAEVMGLPATFTVATPNDGRHLWYAGSIPTTAKKLGPGVDTRGRGGYALLPPSRVLRVDGTVGEYRCEDDREPAPLPTWIAEKLAQRHEAQPAAVDDLDLPVNVDRARARLRDLVRRGDVAIEGSGGDDRTYRVACELRDLGVSGEMAIELLTEPGGWNDACDPPWKDDELRAPVAHAYYYAQNAAGAKGLPGDEIPEAWKRYAAEHPAEPTQEKTRKPRGKLLSLDDLMAMPDPVELVEGFLMVGEQVAFVGPPKHGKSFLGLDVAYSIMSSTAVLGHYKVLRPGISVYLSGEGHAGMKKRFLAWKALRKIDKPNSELPFVYGMGVPLAQGGEAEAEETVNAIQAHLRERGLSEQPVFVVIDTMARSLAGLKENDADAATQYLNMTEHLRSRLGCTVLTIAHATNKGIEKMSIEDLDFRGSSGFAAGFDAVWVLMKNNINGTVCVYPKWHKDADDLEALYFKIKAINIPGFTKMGAGLEYISPNDAKVLSLKDGQIHAGLLKLIVRYACQQAEAGQPVHRPQGRGNPQQKPLPHGGWVIVQCEKDYGFKPNPANCWHHLAHAEKLGFLVYQAGVPGSREPAGYRPGAKPGTEIDDVVF